MQDGRYGDLLRRRGFAFYLACQFLGAFNDNVYRIVLSLLAVTGAASASGSAVSLSLVGAVFIVPFLLFSGYAGRLADSVDKRTVMVYAKSCEIAVMGLGVLALWSGRMGLLLAVLFLMALQSTFFGPAKYGILPEICRPRDLSRANGLVEMTTFLAIILGTSIGGLLTAAWSDQPGRIGAILVIVAVAGWIASLGIPRVAGSDSARRWRWNPWAEISDGLAWIKARRRVALTVAALAWFWFAGALLQFDLVLLGKSSMNLDDLRVGLLGTCLAAGVGIGSMLAGKISGDRVEIGLVPIGTTGMGAVAITLFFTTGSYPASALLILLLGFAGGLFVVPLQADLQLRSDRLRRGQILAASGFVSMGAVLLAVASLWVMRDLAGLSPEAIMLVLGLLTLTFSVLVTRRLAHACLRLLLLGLMRVVYRIRTIGAENVPARGPGLLVCNHVSYVDAFLLGACVERFVRFVAHASFCENAVLGPVLRCMKTIPIRGGDPETIDRALSRAREELRAGKLVAIFPEGAISRTGALFPFRRGLERIVDGLNVPVIPVHLRGVWGSIFSFERGRFFWKWPRRFPYPVTVSFGNPLPEHVTADEARLAVERLARRAA